jgi:hypothetical protein
MKMMIQTREDYLLPLGDHADGFPRHHNRDFLDGETSIVDDQGDRVECLEEADPGPSRAQHRRLTSMSVVQPLLVIGCRVAEWPLWPKQRRPAVGTKSA